MDFRIILSLFIMEPNYDIQPKPDFDHEIEEFMSQRNNHSLVRFPKLKWMMKKYPFYLLANFNRLFRVNCTDVLNADVVMHYSIRGKIIDLLQSIQKETGVDYHEFCRNYATRTLSPQIRAPNSKTRLNRKKQWMKGIKSMKMLSRHGLRDSSTLGSIRVSSHINSFIPSHLGGTRKHH